MNNWETLKISLAELRTNKLKTSLTMLGIVFGVASVIAMMSIGEGARQQSLEQIELLGTNNIIINKKELPKNSEKRKETTSLGLSVKDAESILSIVPKIKKITYSKNFQTNVTYKSNIISTFIVGTTEDYPVTYNFKVKAGRFFNKLDYEGYQNVCIIGSDIKTKIFQFENPLNKNIKIDDQWFKVIGVMERKVIPSSGVPGVRNFNKDIYIPYLTLTSKMILPDMKSNSWGDFANRINKSAVDQITVKIDGDKFIKDAAFIIEKILSRKHFNTDDYEVIIPEQIMEQKQRTQQIFNIVMGAIAGISLLVGGIGIMNIMLANIMERTKEIGIRRAIGATKKDVLNQFLFEALIISIIGGMLGVITGFVLTSIITSYAGWRTVITPLSVAISFLVSLGVGLGFGSYPAKKAADKDPIESLRYE